MKNKFLFTVMALLCSLGLIIQATPTIAAPKPPPAGPVQFPGNKIQQFALELPVLDMTGLPNGTIQTPLDNGTEIPIRMVELRANMLPPSFVPANGQPYAGTAVFGYRVSAAPVAPLTAVDTYVNPVIVATRNQPTQIRYINNLTTNVINWRNWTDVSLHSAFHQALSMPMPTSGDTNHYQGPVLAVPHLHGAEDPAVVDGGPEAWFASDVAGPDTINTYLQHGPAYYSMAGAAPNEAIYRYPNTQEAAPLWFHDHLLGGTRLNATFAGLAGAFLLTDPALTAQFPPGLGAEGLDRNLDGSIAGDEHLVPLVLQDRMFDTNGELFFPNIGVNPEHPYWVPEFVGDTIVVNGKAWPFLNVDQQRYRFFLINGSNSRPYDMFLQAQASGVKYPMWVIATDGGYLDAPVLVDPNATGAQTKTGVQKSLMMMPGERYEIIIDFAGIPAGSNLILRNTAPTVNGNPKASLDGRIMQFRVSGNVPVGGDNSFNPATPGATILTGADVIKRFVNPATGTLAAAVGTPDKTRELTLNEVPGPGGPLEALVNNTKWSGLSTDTTTFPGGVRPDSTQVLGTNQTDFPGWGNYLTELPIEGQTEIWEIVNLTMDSHPIHLHGVQFQLLNREGVNVKGFNAAYAAEFPTGVYTPGFGPPNDYDPALNPVSGGKWGGNPDVTPFLSGVVLPPLPYEAGWKDTAIMHPGEVTRIVVRFAPQDVAVGTVGSFTYNPSALNGIYVWHCHITDHEDNEMMRPDMFMPNPAATRTFIQGIDF